MKRKHTSDDEYNEVGTSSESYTEHESDFKPTEFRSYPTHEDEQKRIMNLQTSNDDVEDDSDLDDFEREEKYSSPEETDS